MKTKRLTLFTFAAGLLAIATPVFAHHGASVYDSQKVTTLKGTVTGFRFMNPHTELSFDVKNADGKVEKWTAEAANLRSGSGPDGSLEAIAARAGQGSPIYCL